MHCLFAMAASATTSIDVAKQVYVAFAKKDVPALLALLDPNVEWNVRAHPSEIPFGGVHKGHEGILDFLKP